MWPCSVLLNVAVTIPYCCGRAQPCWEMHTILPHLGAQCCWEMHTILPQSAVVNGRGSAQCCWELHTILPQQVLAVTVQLDVAMHHAAGDAHNDATAWCCSPCREAGSPQLNVTAFGCHHYATTQGLHLGAPGRFGAVQNSPSTGKSRSGQALHAARTSWVGLLGRQPSPDEQRSHLGRRTTG